MAKLTLNDPTSLVNQSTFLAITQANNDAIETAMENTLSRDGTSPNEMNSNLDMNSNRIINLPAPVSDEEPVRHGDVQVYVDNAQSAANDASANADAAALSASTAITQAGIATSAASTASSAATDAEGFRDDTEDLKEEVQTIVDGLGSVQVFKGGWAANAGTFPGSGVAQAGWTYSVTTGGTVNSIVFNQGDSIVALVNNASTTVYAANWNKLAQNLVTSVAGATGAVSADTVVQAATLATTSTRGPVTLATTAEVQTGTDTAKAVTAAGVTAAALLQGRHTYWVGAGYMTPPDTNGAEATYHTNSNGIKRPVLGFDTTTVEYAHFDIAMPKSWNEGTVTVQPYWTNTAGTSAQTVVWSIKAVATGNDDSLSVAVGTAQTSSDTWLAQNDLHIAPETSAITIAATPAVNDLVTFEISRATGSDNMTGDALLLGCLIFVTINSGTDT